MGRSVADNFLSHLLSEVGRSIGIPQLAAGDDQSCQILFDGRHQVSIVHIPTRGHILLSCAVGATTLTADQALEVVRSNFMQAAGGIVACASPKDGRLLLQYGVPRNEASAATILTSIEALLQQVEAWEVKQARAQPSEPKPHTVSKFLMRSV
jgi:hypothetical protein